MAASAHTNAFHVSVHIFDEVVVVVDGGGDGGDGGTSATIRCMYAYRLGLIMRMGGGGGPGAYHNIVRIFGRSATTETHTHIKMHTAL